MQHSFGGSKDGDVILFCVQGFQRVFVGFCCPWRRIWSSGKSFADLERKFCAGFIPSVSFRSSGGKFEAAHNWTGWQSWHMLLQYSESTSFSAFQFEKEQLHCHLGELLFYWVTQIAQLCKCNFVYSCSVENAVPLTYLLMVGNRFRRKTFRRQMVSMCGVSLRICLQTSLGASPLCMVATYDAVVLLTGSSLLLILLPCEGFRVIEV